MARLLGASLLSQPADSRVLDRVAQELAHWASIPFEWGVSDCALSVLGYAERRMGRRFDHTFRYASKNEAELIKLQNGGFTALAVWAMGQLGCPRVAIPERGDVGLVAVPGSGLTACLCLGEMWAARGHRQVVIFPGRAARAWAVRPRGEGAA